MFATMLVCMGVAMFVGGAVGAMLHRERARPLSLLRRLERASKKRGTDGARAVGRIAAGDRGTVVAPCSGREAVWFRVRSRQLLGTDGSGAELWSTVDDRREWRPFRVETDSGRAVSLGVEPTAIVEVRRFAAPEIDRERIRAFFSSRGANAEDANIYEEEALGVGDHVMVAGLALPDVAGQAEPYREAAVVLAAPHALGPVVATQRGLKQLRRSPYLVARTTLLIGAVVALIGVFLRLSGMP